MYASNSRRWLALAVAFGFAASAARADVITPDSIANPPSAVGSANGTSVYAGNLVTGQYAGMGLHFGSGAAITNLNGVNVWAPTEMLAQPASHIAGVPPVNLPAAQISYYGTWGGASFVVPGTTAPAVATSLSVEIMGNPLASVLVHYANNPGVAIPASIVVASEPNGGRLYTFQPGPGITSFSVFAPVIDPPPGAASPAMAINPAWGVAEISFTLAHAPEPSSLVLAGLGAIGLAARFGRRRTRDKVE
ncbi:MAG TPA: PEP-CTERM sorting domain-containing protein [Gemmataceae bacterium]|jgi:hypothetical protein